jgi:hypothetical protein
MGGKRTIQEENNERKTKRREENNTKINISPKPFSSEFIMSPFFFICVSNGMEGRGTD